MRSINDESADGRSPQAAAASQTVIYTVRARASQPTYIYISDKRKEIYTVISSTWTSLAACCLVKAMELQICLTSGEEKEWMWYSVQPIK